MRRFNVQIIRVPERKNKGKRAGRELSQKECKKLAQIDEVSGPVNEKRTIQRPSVGKLQKNWNDDTICECNSSRTKKKKRNIIREILGTRR